MRGDGEVRLTIIASLAQDESRKMSERTKAGIQTSQKKGTYVAGPTPFGYKRDKKAHTLVVQESQAETVRKIFAWYAPEIIFQTDAADIRSPRPPFFHRGRNAGPRC